MIPIINKMGKPARFKTHHNLKKGIDAIHWKGGRRINSQNYVLIYSPEHPFADNGKCVREHRLVYEKYLTELNNNIPTFIHPSIEIDHIDGNRQNNSINNLRMFIKKQHMSIHKLSRIIPIGNRICHICKSSTTTLRKNGHERWYNYKNELICHKCYMKKSYRKTH